MAVSYRFVPLRLRDVVVVARWRYPGQYAFYNSTMREMLAIWLAQAALRLLGRTVYYSVLGLRGELAGIFSFVLRGAVVEIGLGMRPDLTGLGLGQEFVAAGLAFAREQFVPAGFRLDVARFNERAIRVYERAGFTATRTFERRLHGKPYEFVEMVRVA
jgi:[ribosomal protein S18]-alanine N-acetyltransferase